MCLSAILCLIALNACAGTTYEVGPGKVLTAIGAVPWETLAAGDTVLIYAKPNLDPYREKWVIARTGTAALPITVRGIADASGNLPVISGESATTRLQLDYTNESRGLIKIGTSNNAGSALPAFIVIENLDLTSARMPYTFTDDAGVAAAYVDNAAAIYIERGQNITIRNCRIHDSGNGLFVGIYNGETQNILVDGNYIYDNGNVGSNFEHNNYTAAIGITFQYNHFGPLRAGCPGKNLKDRSIGTVVRYNWIESGNRQLDLVDIEDAPALNSDPRYRETFVYGNVLIEPESGNSQICHYGGDGADTNIYRKGTLHFFNNTVVSTRTTNTTLLRLSTNDETADVRNNLLYVTQTGNRFAILDNTGTANLSCNWMKTGFVKSHSNALAVVNTINPNVLGTDPAFVDLNGQNFQLLEISACRNAAGSLNAAAQASHVPVREYVKHQLGRDRPADVAPDIGAFEFTLIHAPNPPDNFFAAAFSDTQINLVWNDESTDETGFEIERSPDGLGTWTPLVTKAANSVVHSDTGLTARTPYFYRIRATNFSGASAFSIIASATTLGPGQGGGGGGSNDPNDPDGDGLANDLDPDDDNDGFSDTAELAAGTDPNSALSVPQDAKIPMTLTKLSGTVRFFVPGFDSFSVSGVLPNLPALFNPGGLALVLNSGGAIRAITLTEKGKGKLFNGNASLTLKPSVRNKTTKNSEFLGGNVIFKATLKNGDWKSVWTDDGINPDTTVKNASLPMTVDVTLNGIVYTETVTTLYNGAAQKSGRFKFSRKLPK